MAGTRAIIHVDMDAFYASVEQRDDPRLRGRPVIVGGHPKRGVVLAASYEVRRFGVHSAMPMGQALRLAPKAIVVPPRGEAYAEASERVHAIFEAFTPLVEPLSLDEAFLDVTGSIALFGPASEIARAIRGRIRRELELPASAGIASVKFVAKMVSDLAKPDGQHEVPPGEERAFLAPLPVSRLWGVGPKTQAHLARLGLETIGDVANRDAAWLEAHLGESGHHFHALSRGIDDRPVVPDREAKSIGAEDTFEEDLGDLDALGARIHAQALRVGRRLRRSGVRARAVVLKLKLSDFTLRTRRTTLKEPSDDGQALFAEAKRLLEREWPLEKRVRLTGVSAIQLTGDGAQLPLFLDGKAARAKKLNATLDAIAERFGTGALLPADVVEREVTFSETVDETRRKMGASVLDFSSPRGRRR